MIVYGNYSIPVPRGWVADYCLICREARRFRLKVRLNLLHLYFVPLIPYGTDGYLITCEVCGTQYQAERSRYGEPVGARNMELVELIERTNTHLPEELSKRLEAEEQAASNDAGAMELRRKMLMEPFVFFQPEFTAKDSGIQLDWIGGLTSVGCVAVGIGTAFLWFVDAWKLQTWAVVAGIVAAALLGVTIWRAATETKRRIRRKYYPRLARSLAAIGVGRDELGSVLETMSTSKRILATHIDVDELYQYVLEYAEQAMRETSAKRDG